MLEELMLIHQQLGPGEPLATYGKEDCWEVWTREQASKALRDLAGKQGLIPGEHTLHSDRIGGATRLAALGLQAWATQREGKWMRDAFITHVRANREDWERVSQALARKAKAEGIQPGQGTMWGGE